MSYRPLGDEDSFPADPEAISAYGAELAATGELILEQVELLRALSRGDCWVADTADAFREQAQELADQIEQASGRYVTVGATLKTVADDLSDLERRAADRAEEAQALQRTIAANPPASPEVPPDGGPAVLTPEGEQQNARRQRALERMAALQGEFDGFARAARDAAGTAAGRIRSAVDDRVKDNWWERNASWLGTAKTVLGWGAAIAGIALLVVGAIATAPVWLTALAIGLAVATAAISVGLALEADGSWTEAAFDVIGAASLGTGSLFTRMASEAFPAVRSTVAGIRASRAHQGRYALESAENLTELRRYASVAVDATGDNVAARQLLAEVATQARSAASAARSSTFAPFPVTRVQQFVDGGDDVSRVTRQAREMLLDLRTLPGAPIAPEAVQAATTLVRTSTVGIVATNIGAGSQVVQALVNPGGSGSNDLNIITDLVPRLL